MPPNGKQLSLMYSGTRKCVACGTSNSKYNDVLQHCIVTKITSVNTEQHVMKMPIINTRANAGRALPGDTVK